MFFVLTNKKLSKSFKKFIRNRELTAEQLECIQNAIKENYATLYKNSSSIKKKTLLMIGAFVLASFIYYFFPIFNVGFVYLAIIIVYLIFMYKHMNFPNHEYSQIYMELSKLMGKYYPEIILERDYFPQNYNEINGDLTVYFKSLK